MSPAKNRDAMLDQFTLGMGAWERDGRIHFAYPIAILVATLA